jgi:hypothetical protein
VRQTSLRMTALKHEMTAAAEGSRMTSWLA